MRFITLFPSGPGTDKKYANPAGTKIAKYVTGDLMKILKSRYNKKPVRRPAKTKNSSFHPKPGKNSNLADIFFGT